MDAGGDRVAVFGLSNDAGLPIYVHSKACVIDDRWASVGSDNLNRRSWTFDTEVAAAVFDDRNEGGPAPEDSFAVRLRRELISEHLGCAPSEVPDDPVELFDAMVSCADALDAWFASNGSSGRHGVRGLDLDRGLTPAPAGTRARAGAGGPGRRPGAGEVSRPRRASARPAASTGPALPHAHANGSGRRGPTTCSSTPTSPVPDPDPTA